MIAIKIFLVVATIAAAAGLFVRSAGPAIAKGSNGHAGWASQQGETNRQGPPSQSTFPGWGFGDPNHTHTGPPGHSTFPGQGP